MTQLLDDMMAWENGTLPQDETVELFQRLVDNGMAWTLQGMYGRQAMRFIQAGLVTSKWNVVNDRPKLDTFAAQPSWGYSDADLIDSIPEPSADVNEVRNLTETATIESPTRLPDPNVNPWETFQGMGQALTLSELITKLQAMRADRGDLPVNLRNYLEENTVAPVTDCTIDHNAVVLESEDLPASKGVR